MSTVCGGASVTSLQVRLGNVQHRLPSVETFRGEYLEVLGQSQSRQPLSQVAHVGIGERGEDGWW
jgi:hypothetical protein